ncbi:hypothetical protein NK6_5577 [Bradyrhizobium diazoefficiens]|uniref:Uncharacterized protein n=1 Tax=Bradyrhizobium diazoefficiens TaxID=1355477 RepID=A0A0E3VV88_9BRAD|nr:hypothetical protein NK6_5577 [Bradyrhizobium diazoefficiens]
MGRSAAHGIVHSKPPGVRGPRTWRAFTRKMRK